MVKPEGVKIKMAVPSDLVPHCPKCGYPMTMNLRADNTFVEDEGWHKAVYACINYGDAAAPREIQEKSICIDGDIGEILFKLS